MIFRKRAEHIFLVVMCDAAGKSAYLSMPRGYLSAKQGSVHKMWVYSRFS